MARRHIMESTFRLNLLNPQHAKINEVIKGLNPKILKRLFMRLEMEICMQRKPQLH